MFQVITHAGTELWAFKVQQAFDKFYVWIMTDYGITMIPLYKREVLYVEGEG